MTKKLNIFLAGPRGFCAGVDRAIEMVKGALKKYGAPVYVRHEIVHNKFVVENLKSQGAIFVEELNEIEDRSRPVIFSAHGVPKAVPEEALSLNLVYYDATCPLVTKVHLEVMKHAKQGRDIVLIGHKGHPEVIGTLGRHPADSSTQIVLVEDSDDIAKLELNQDAIAYVTQTTLSVDETIQLIDELREKYPKIVGPSADDICYATQNRQDAVKQLSLECDLVLVIGSTTSSNSNRLKELAEKCGTKSYLIDGINNIDPKALEGVAAVGITAGASAPEEIVQEVIDYLASYDFKKVRDLSQNKENLTFKLPKELAAL